jgi:hypothetical protein
MTLRRTSMSKTKWSAAILGLVAALGLTHLTCHQAPMLAPPGSTLTLFANPTFIPAFGGRSVISALVIEPAGTPVADGTVVQFFTNLGRIDEQGKTNDGIARVNLVADGRSGTATVTAVSGGEAVAPSPTPPPTTTTVPSSLTAAPSTGTASSTGVAVTGAAVSALQASASIDIAIGSSLPAFVKVTAFPPRLTDRRSTLITANVFDDNGNPVANVPVIFEVVPAGDDDVLTGFERMDSQGTPTFTDNNGQAQDIMRTSYPVDQPQRIARVNATTATEIEGFVDVVIN